MTEVSDFRADPSVADQKIVKLLETKDEFEQFFGQSAPASVDFSKSDVVFFSNGTWPSGGYRARITSLSFEWTSNKLDVDTDFISPGDGCFRTMAFTSPSHLVKFDKPATHIASVDPHGSEETVDCTEE
jgi:hypothetical protein